jgi:hypothetical protein
VLFASVAPSPSRFHWCWDCHANTLELIFDIKGNIFGGFTPVEWESGDMRTKDEQILGSFIFALKTPIISPRESLH